MCTSLNDGIYKVGCVDVGDNSMLDIQKGINSGMSGSVIFEVLNQLNPNGSVKGFNIVGKKRNESGLCALLSLLNLSQARDFEYLKNILLVVSSNSDLAGNYERDGSGLWVKESTGNFNYRTISKINSDYI